MCEEPHRVRGKAGDGCGMQEIPLKMGPNHSPALQSPSALLAAKLPKAGNLLDPQFQPRGATRGISSLLLPYLVSSFLLFLPGAPPPLSLKCFEALRGERAPGLRAGDVCSTGTQQQMVVFIPFSASRENRWPRSSHSAARPGSLIPGPWDWEDWVGRV